MENVSFWWQFAPVLNDLLSMLDILAKHSLCPYNDCLTNVAAFNNRVSHISLAFESAEEYVVFGGFCPLEIQDIFCVFLKCNILG